jgi:transposase
VMTRLFWLSDEAWAAIDRHLPRGKPGKPRVDDRRVISGILHVQSIVWPMIAAGRLPSR